MKFNRLLITLFAVATILTQASAKAAEPSSSASTAIVQPLLDKEQSGVPGKELLMATVEYLPAGASLPHRHDAQVFVYVLEGHIKMQVTGGPEVTLGPGQTFYESPTDVHAVSANASKTKRAKFLVFIVKDKAAPVTREIAPPGAS